jgi:DNA-binding transcriptional MocR family regulator
MTETRRLALLRLARQSHAVVVEDAVMEDLVLRRAPPSLAALEPDRVITIGSLSKTVWGGLRVGWIRASGEAVLRLGRVRASFELGSPVLEQAAALQVLDDYDELLERRRELVATRLAVLCEELRARLPEWTFPEPRGGLCVWAQLPRGSADALAQLALRRGVAIASGRTAAPSEEFLGHVRLSAGPAPAAIREGMRRLGSAWEELDRGGAPLDHPRVLV